MKFKSILLMLTGLTLILAACAAPTAAPTQPQADTPAPAATDTSASPSDTPGAAAPVSFANDVMPILQNRCFNCHGGEQTKQGLSFASYDTLMAGSKNGPVIVPGDSGNSLLIQMIQKGKMPKRGPKLTPDQLQIIIDWITQGALNN